MNEATLQYVRQHADDDVRQLALRGSKHPDVDLAAALQQIAGRQTARKKLPSWAALDDILYPPHLNMEQCSSEQTARYKASLCRTLLQKHKGTTSLIDLTGGFGVDFAWMSEAFSEGTYIERNSELFAVATNNFRVLQREVEARNVDAIDYLHQVEHATMIFLDPARRDEHGARTYGIADCTPDVLQLRDELLRKADYVLLKLSPMLDWRKTVADLGEQWVREVHIVSVGGECKELLLLLSMQGTGFRLCCVNDHEVFEVNEGTTVSDSSSDDEAHLVVGSYLYEPNASVMKAGCFAELSARFSVCQLAQNSHLFVSDRFEADFPGRKFRVVAVSSMNKRELKETIAPLGRANITVRNFPLSVAELRRRLKLSEGGSHYIFATTLAHGDRVLIVCQHC